MKKIVIAGSASLSEKIGEWKGFWESQGYDVINYPVQISPESFLDEYPKVHADFFRDITKADTLFVMNEDKNGISGYLWAQTFAEMAFGVARNLLWGDKKLEISLLKMPDKNVQSYEEIERWLKFGWIRLYEADGTAMR